jgi:hypothetical protein
LASGPLARLKLKMEHNWPEYIAKTTNAGMHLSQAKLLLLQAAIGASSSQESIRLRNLASASAELVNQLQSIALAPEPPCSNSDLAKKNREVL